MVLNKEGKKRCDYIEVSTPHICWPRETLYYCFLCQINFRYIYRCSLSDLHSTYVLKSFCLYHVSYSHFCSCKWLKHHLNWLPSSSTWFTLWGRLEKSLYLSNLVILWILKLFFPLTDFWGIRMKQSTKNL